MQLAQREMHSSTASRSLGPLLSRELELDESLSDRALPFSYLARVDSLTCSNMLGALGEPLESLGGTRREREKCPQTSIYGIARELETSSNEEQPMGQERDGERLRCPPRAYNKGTAGQEGREEGRGRGRLKPG